MTMSATRWAATRRKPGFAAAMVHRLSGLALAIFLPMHFLALGLAFDESRFGAFIAWSDVSIVKFSEFALVTALAMHMAGGLRILALEILHWPATATRWIVAAFAVGIGFGLLFLMGAVS